MELPPWLKIENLIRNLNFRGWFRGWFKHENKTEININNTYNINFVLPTNADGSPEKIGANEVPPRIEDAKENKFNFSDNEKFLLNNVNQIHRLNGSKYNFEYSYGLALQHIKNKSSSDWFVAAAAHMANAIQSGDINLGIEQFFNSFETDEDPEKTISFSGFKEKVKYCYDRLQNLRHVDKSEELKNHMIPEYHRKISGQNKISNQDYQQIFIDFQNLLVELFSKYKIKISL